MRKRNGNLQLAFDPYGPAVFLLIMLPNVLWLLWPAPQDILRGASATPILDGAASAFQAVMVAASCIVYGRERRPLSKPTFAGIAAAILLYFAAWTFYYAGVTAPPVILTLCAAPCLAFLFLAAARKNAISFCAAVVFAICHTLSGLINFIL